MVGHEGGVTLKVGQEGGGVTLKVGQEWAAGRGVAHPR